MLLPFFLFTDLYFVISAVITQIITPIAELLIPIEIPFKEKNNKCKHIQ